MDNLIFNPEEDITKLEYFGLTPRYDEYTGEVIAYEKIDAGNKFLRLDIIKKKKKGMIRFFKNYDEKWEIYPMKGYFDVSTLYDLIQANLIIKE